MTCPNPACQASLKREAPAGTKLRCPRCNTMFVVPPEPAPAAEAGTIGLVPETESSCPECKAVLPPRAVLCVNCGFDLRTGKKLEAPKKSPKKRSRRTEREALTEANLPELLEEAETLIDLARKELWRLPHVLGMGDDARLARQGMVAGRPNRCDNPNCGTGLRNLDGSNWYVRVTFSAQGERMVVNLCQTCADILQADLSARNATARSYLSEARADVERAAKRFPKHPEIVSALQEIRKVELLATEATPRKRGCFIATAAFGSPFAAEVEILRQLRDSVLEQSILGRCLIRIYYVVSPPLAALIARSAASRAVVRCLLAPVVRWARRRLISR
jgi:hypothetical protein